MYVIDFTPKAFKPLKQNTRNQKWEIYALKAFTKNRAIVSKLIHMPHFLPILCIQKVVGTL